MGKYLDFYKKCMKRKRMPQDGLCHNDIPGLEIFYPTNVELRRHAKELGYGYSVIAYWAAGLLMESSSSSSRAFDFTPLRQNIVLFLAAMADEDFSELSL